MDPLSAETIYLAAFRLECNAQGIGLPERPTYQQTATALHKLVKKTGRSLKLLDPPATAPGVSPSPMVVFAAKDRRASPKPAKWPSPHLQKVRRSEAARGRSKKPKKKINSDLVAENKPKNARPTTLPDGNVT
jgi:hypothetical protein